ncbi:MAG: class I SAM-dependent methyltransferase [Geminicoccaceae bacterium]
MNAQQRSTATFAGRHDYLLRLIARRLDGGRGRKILSFGCSEGWECLDIADAMPAAQVYGCDVNDKALAAAAERCAGRATIFKSTLEGLAEHGPFDLITAFNVLCRYPETSGKFDIAKIYPFAEFEDGLVTIDRALMPGGLLALYNSPYFLEDAQALQGYAPAEDCFIANNGWTEKHNPDGSRATRVLVNANGRIYTREEIFALGKLNAVAGRREETKEWRQHALPYLTWQEWLPDRQRKASLVDVFWRKPGSSGSLPA